MLEFDLTETDATPELPEHLDVWQDTLNWQPDAAVRSQFQGFYRCVRQGNRQANLTRILEPEDFWEKHLWDSLRGIAPFLSGEFPLPERPRVVDIGTGGGFPGIPVALACPHWSLWLLDSTQKKVRFLQAAIAELGLDNVRAIAGRGETLGTLRPYRQACDIALLRAVGPAERCLKYSFPWLKAGGWLVLYRGHWSDAEEATLKHEIDPLGMTLERVDNFVTPQTQGVRNCLFLRREQ